MLSRRVRGFSLIELMIALALGAAILAGTIALLVSTLGFNRDLLLATRSQQDLRLLLDLSLRDIARAGGWRAAGTVASISQTHDLLLGARSGSFTATAVKAGTNTVAAVFSTPLDSQVLTGRVLVFWIRNAAGLAETYELSVTARPGTGQLSLNAGTLTLPVDRIAAGSWTLRNPLAGVTAQAGCLVFAYDEDGDSQRGAQERFGYRHDSSDQALEGANNADRCDTGSWQNISDERVLRVSRLQIDAPAVALDAGSARRLHATSIALSLTASLRADNGGEHDLQGAIRVRNDALE